MVCDGDTNAQEVADFHTYRDTMEQYREGSYLGPADAKSSVDVSELRTEVAGEKTETLEELLEQLDKLTGLASVKRDVTQLVHIQSIQQVRKQRGLPLIPLSNHLVFFGNPGTGKTTVARLLAKIYHRMGILSTGAFVETDRAGLCAGYVGQTALKTQEVIKKAMGGVLFIDEAYTLANHGFESDYGHEAIETILKAMEDNRDNLIVIVAGYPKLMAQFINSNPGLRSRFNKYISFPDYQPDELMEIFDGMCADAKYTVSGQAEAKVREVLTERYTHRDENFANAREVRNLFEKIMFNQADRLYGMADPTDEQLCMITERDVPKAAESVI